MRRVKGLERSKIQARHIRAKTLYYHIVKILRQRFEICEAESEAIAYKTLRYLDSKLNGERRSNQIIIEGYEPKKGKKPTRSLTIRLTYYDLSDIEVEERFGKDGARYNRVIRFFEEAFSQGAVLRTTKIAQIAGLTRTIITKIVRHYRNEGVRVWLRGQHSGSFEGVCRDTRALELLFDGVREEDVMRKLFMGKRMLQNALEELALVGSLVDRGFNAQRITEASNLPSERVKEYRELWKLHKGTPLLPEREIESDEYIEEYGKAISRASLCRELSRDYQFTPGGTRLFFKEIDGLEEEMRGSRLLENQILYYAVREEIGAGHSIAECKLTPVVLTIYNDKERNTHLGETPPNVKKQRTRMLKENRINRLAVEAKQQCGLLSFEDISYLTGLHIASISLILRGLRAREVAPPLRGAQKDMGKGVSHEVKAIEYYLLGYSEDVIARKLHHGLDQLVMYQKRFKQAMLLREDGYSPTMVSILSGISKKKVEDLLRLYERYKKRSEFQRRLSWIRNLGNGGKKKCASPPQCYGERGGENGKCE